MPVFHVRTLATAGALVAALAAVPAEAQQDAAVAVKDYAVFVDLPSAFAFIKLPTGWKFIGKLDADQLRHLPADTLTSLLPPEDGPVNLAGELRALPAKR